MAIHAKCDVFNEKINLNFIIHRIKFTGSTVLYQSTSRWNHYRT